MRYSLHNIYIYPFFLSRGTFRRPYFQAIGGYTYHAGQSWKADPGSDGGSLAGPIRSIAAADNSGADLGVFMCKDPMFFGVVGLAYVGTLCRTSSGSNAGVNEKRQNVLATSEVHKISFKLITVPFSTHF